jgi:hypothetical protein
LFYFGNKKKLFPLIKETFFYLVNKPKGPEAPQTLERPKTPGKSLLSRASNLNKDRVKVNSNI